MLDFDKFGYYIGAGRKTYSRIEAIEYAKGNDIQWNFNDEVFSAFDWTKEPQQDLNYFYDLRAHQLRNEYDYIVLFYSGGYDSHNILKTFIDNNLHIDEILTMIPSLDTFSTPTIEYKKYTQKKLKQYENELQKTQIRLIEYKDLLIDIMRSNKQDILYLLNYKHTLYHLIKDEFKNVFIDHRKQIEKGKKMVYIYGVDKPSVFEKDKKFYFEFSDSIIVNKVTPQTQFNKINDIFYEFFYWDSSCVSLMIKQAHVVKRLLKNNININSEILNFEIYPRCKNDNEIGYFDENSYRNFFTSYNKKHRVNKVASIGGRDSWFYTMNNDLAINALKCSNYISDTYPKHFINNECSDYQPMLPIKKKYFIGE